MENLPPVVTPFGPLRTPTGASIVHLRPRHAPLAVERLSETCPPAGLRRHFSTYAANDSCEQLRINAKRRRSLFDRACDRLADFIADCVERPGTALVLVSIGQMTVIVPAVLWAWF